MRLRSTKLIVAGMCLLAWCSRSEAQWTEPRRIGFHEWTYDTRAIFEGESFYVVSGQGVKFLKSSDAGEHWTEPVNPIDYFAAAHAPDIACSANRLNMIISGYEEDFRYRNLYYFFSSDGGDTWGHAQAVFPGRYDFSMIGRIVAEGNSLYLAGGSGSWLKFAKSTDEGDTWYDPITLEDDSLENYPIITKSPGAIHIFYILHVGPYKTDLCYRRSSNDGASWSDRITLSDHSDEDPRYYARYPSACVGPDGELHVFWGDSKFDTMELLTRASFDNGVTWLPEVRITYDQSCYESSAVVLGEKIYVIWTSYDPRLPYRLRIAYSKSTDRGTTWQDHNLISGERGDDDGWPSLLYTIDGQDTTLHCVMARDSTGRDGIYYFNNSGYRTDIGNQLGLFPGAISLGGYPNPFNSKAVLSYSLPEAGRTNISVFDILGRRVTVLVDGLYQPGEHLLEWDAAGMRSGVYIIRLQTSGDSRNIMMTVLK